MQCPCVEPMAEIFPDAHPDWLRKLNLFHVCIHCIHKLIEFCFAGTHCSNCASDCTNNVCEYAGTNEHTKCCRHSFCCCHGYNISIPDCGHGHDCPVQGDNVDLANGKCFYSIILNPILFLIPLDVLDHMPAASHPMCHNH